jgi:hypothetical protein
MRWYLRLGGFVCLEKGGAEPNRKRKRIEMMRTGQVREQPCKIKNIQKQHAKLNHELRDVEQEPISRVQLYSGLEILKAD